MHAGVVITIGLAICICVVATIINYFSDELITSCDTVEDMGFITGHLFIAVLSTIIGSLAFSTAASFTKKVV